MKTAPLLSLLACHAATASASDVQHLHFRQRIRGHSMHTARGIDSVVPLLSAAFNNPSHDGLKLAEAEALKLARQRNRDDEDGGGQAEDATECENATSGVGDMLDTTVLPKLNETHDHHQEDIDEVQKHFEQCKDTFINATSRYDAMRAAKAAKLKSMITCRTAEKSLTTIKESCSADRSLMETDATTSCESFRAFEVDNSDQVNAEDCSFVPGSMDFELFLQSHMQHFTTNEERFKTMKKSCDERNAELSGKTSLCNEQSDDEGDKKGECDTEQKEFEEQACVLATAVRDDWSTYKSCFDAAKVALSTLKTDLAGCEAKLQEEYATYQRVKCYVNVSCTSDSAAQLDACDTEEYKSPHLELSWFEEHSEEPISDDKDIDTCSESFISDTYLSEPEAAQPAACTPCLLPEIN